MDSEGYLARCLSYIDLNMVRAGVISHPCEWPESGYGELQNPPRRYRLTDIERLTELLGLSSLRQLQQARAEWVEESLGSDRSRHEIWSEGIAVGSEDFVREIKAKLGGTALYRNPTRQKGISTLSEPPTAYNVHFDGRMERLSTNSGQFSQ